jgi:hypothetical protein
MNVHAAFGLCALLGVAAWALLAKLYAWRRLRTMDRQRALMALVVPHTFRFVGLSFLVPGVVSPGLPATFAVPAAYGDLAAMALAFLSMIALARRARWATGITWVFNVVGTLDLLFAIFDGNVLSRIDPGMLGAAFYIPTVAVPALLVSHALIYGLLVVQARAHASFEMERRK